jgi:hypothetical protein
MNRLQAAKEPRYWQRPQWIHILEKNTSQFAQLYPDESGLLTVGPEDQYQGMYRGRIHAARALAYCYWNILKDVWPAGTPTVAEMGCGAYLSLYEIFPHEDLPNQWLAFDMVKSLICHASQIKRFSGWPITLREGNAYSPPFDQADILIGQSSYDSILNLPAALAAIKSKIRYLVHFQEVNPTLEPIFRFTLSYPGQERQWLTDINDAEFDSRAGYQAQRIYKKELTGLSPAETSHILAEVINNILDVDRERLSFRLPNGEQVGCQDEFQDRFNFCLEQAGYKIIKTGTAEGIYRGPKLEHHGQLPQIAVQTLPATVYPPNYYIWAGGWSRFGYATEVEQFQETAYVRYVVAEAV